MKLYEITKQYAGLMDLSDELPEEALKDTLEAITEQFDEKALACAAVIKNLNGEADSIDAEIKRLTDMKKARANRVTSLKSYLLSNMQLLEKDKIKGAIFSVSRQKGRMSVVCDSNPEDMEGKFQKHSVTLDKTAIKKAIESGDEVLGASLKRGNDILMIR